MGPDGFAGPKGIRGNTGLYGPRGDVGLPGASVEGPQGFKGYTGTSTPVRTFYLNSERSDGLLRISKCEKIGSMQQRSKRTQLEL